MRKPSPSHQAPSLRIANVSPLCLDRDSRSYRAVLSFRRFGYDAFAVEGQASVTDPELIPFPVITLSGGSRSIVNTSRNNHSSIRALIRKVLPGFLWECGTFVWFVTQVFGVNIIKGLRRVPPADLYYLHEYSLFPMVYLLARRTGAKIVYDAHDFYPGVHADADLTPFWRHVFRPFLIWLEGRCIKGVDGMVTVNQGIADLYKETFGVDAAITRNCHDTAMDAQVDQGVRETLGLSGTDFLIVIVGNRKPGQHLAPALEAISRLPSDVYLAFVGRGYETLAEDLPALGLSKRVHIIPSVPANMVVPFIRSADASLILYYARSQNDVHFLPNGFFQAIAAGLPVLYPGLRWIKEIAEEFGIGVEIDSADAGDIFAGVEQLREQIGTGQMGDALDRAVRETSWRTEEQVLKELIERIVENEPNA